jgi:hypothetical protein
MSAIKLSTPSSGSISLSPADTASNLTITVPAVSGTMITTGSTFAGTGPAFSVYLATAQTVTANTFTKVTLDTEEFDTNSNFASNRFTPTTAGYYQINSIVRFNTTTNLTNVTNSIYKNGTEYKRTQLNGVTFTAALCLGNSCVVYLNGSTDYIELYGFISGSGTLSFVETISATSMSGCLVRAA